MIAAATARDAVTSRLAAIASQSGGYVASGAMDMRNMARPS